MIIIETTAAALPNPVSRAALTCLDKELSSEQFFL